MTLELIQTFLLGVGVLVLMVKDMGYSGGYYDHQNKDSLCDIAKELKRLSNAKVYAEEKIIHDNAEKYEQMLRQSVKRIR